ncbi:phage holin family protein [Nocardioides sp. AN3]
MTQSYGTPGTGDQSAGELVSRLSKDISVLIRDELRLAQAEMSGKAKRAGIGAGMFGVAGMLAFYGVGVLIAAAVIALALAVEPWLSAVIIGVVLLAVAGIVALVGKKRVSDAAPMVPTQALDNVKQDVDAVRHAREN